jgi:Transposase
MADDRIDIIFGARVGELISGPASSEATEAVADAPPNWWTPLLSSGGAERCRMGQGRRHFTDEFKQEAIALLVSSGWPLSQIASELGISPSMRCATGAMEAEGGMQGRRGA